MTGSAGRLRSAHGRFARHCGALGGENSTTSGGEWKLIFQNTRNACTARSFTPSSPADALHQRVRTTSPRGRSWGVHADHRAQRQRDGERRACALPLGTCLPTSAAAYYYTIFPNLMLSIHPDYAVAYRCGRRGRDARASNASGLFLGDAVGRADFNPDDAVQFWDLTNQQDWHICEQSFAGFSSRAYVPGPTHRARACRRVGPGVSRGAGVRPGREKGEWGKVRQALSIPHSHSPFPVTTLALAAPQHRSRARRPNRCTVYGMPWSRSSGLVASQDLGRDERVLVPATSRRRTRRSRSAAAGNSRSGGTSPPRGSGRSGRTAPSTAQRVPVAVPCENPSRCSDTASRRSVRKHCVVQGVEVTT